MRKIQTIYILAAVVNEVDLAAEAAGSAVKKNAGDANDSLPASGDHSILFKSNRMSICLSVSVNYLLYLF